MIARVTAGLLAVVLAAVGRADQTDPEPPPMIAGEVVKVEVTRYADGVGRKSRTHESANIKETVRAHLTHFREAGGGERPNAGPPTPSGLSYSVVLRRAKSRAIRAFVRDDGRRWFCYPGTADLRATGPREAARYLDDLLK